MKILLMASILMMAFVVDSGAEDAPKFLYSGGDKAILARAGVFPFFIEIDDQTSDACLQDPGALKDKMEVFLRKNGFELSNAPMSATDSVVITVLGYKNGSSSCVSYVSTELQLLVLARAPFARLVPGGDETMIKFTYKIGSTLLSGSQNTMQARLMEVVENHADNLYLEISRAQDSTFKKFPIIGETIESWKKENKK
jgi:hypothetical protein